MGQRTHYWSCSSFADWVRGTTKPTAATNERWREWHRKAKTAHPFRYWLAEDVLHSIQQLIWWPVDKLYGIKYYINNRFITRTHSLTAHSRDIKPGQWCDVGNRFLPCLFNELVDFVEIEQAWHHVAWDEEARKKYNPPFYAVGWFRWRTWRCPAAGLDYLHWACGLTDEEWLEEDKKHLAKPTGQALAAKEIIALYTWWKEVYPNRLDPHDASGWSEHCRVSRADSDGLDYLDTPTDENQQREIKRMLGVMDKMEKEYEDEDTEMLTRLIKIRKHLWT